MGLFRKTVFTHEWNKKDVDVIELKKALEGESSSYPSDVLKKVSKKYLKYEKRGVSNLYLVKEADDEGVVIAVYAYSTIEDTIDEEMLSAIREAASNNLSVGEMRGESFDQKPDEWWETNVDSCIKRVEKGKPNGFMDYLSAELASKGIIITERQVRKRKAVNELECSAVAWGIKEGGLRSGIKSRVLQNEIL